MQEGIASAVEVEQESLLPRALEIVAALTRPSSQVIEKSTGKS